MHTRLGARAHTHTRGEGPQGIAEIVPALYHPFKLPRPFKPDLVITDTVITDTVITDIVIHNTVPAPLPRPAITNTVIADVVTTDAGPAVCTARRLMHTRTANEPLSAAAG